jgi:hypothetical protein
MPQRPGIRNAHRRDRGNAMILYGSAAMKLAKLFGVLGAIALLACVSWTAYEGFKVDVSADCNTKLSTALASSATEADDAGALRIVDVWPETVQLSGRLCIVVAGVTPAPSDPLYKYVDPNRSTVEIALFLNGHRAPSTVYALVAPRPQVLTYELGQTTDSTSDVGRFWRGLLAGKTRHGIMPLSVGVSRSQSSGPEAISSKPVKMLVYRLPILALGGLSVLLIVAAFIILAANSTILRDSALTRGEAAARKARDARSRANAASPPDNNLNAVADQAERDLQTLTGTADAKFPAGTFSLGRSQVALWLGLSISGYIFLWLTFGFYLNVITAAIPILLGINGVTGITAYALDQQTDPTRPPPAPAESRSFLRDLSCDAEGPKLQRIQVLLWTSVLAVIFIWNVVWNFVFVDFDSNMLLLMGIANSMYVGFKTQEK